MKAKSWESVLIINFRVFRSEMMDSYSGLWVVTLQRGGFMRDWST